MYNETIIAESWGGLIAWRQNYNVNGEQLEADLITGETGLFYQDEHVLMNLDVIQSIMPDHSLVNYPVYGPLTPYVVGQIVEYNGVNYTCIQDGTGETPDAPGSLYWVVHRPLNQFLRDKVRAGIVNTVQDFIEEKQMQKAAKSLLRNGALFLGVGRRADVIANNDRRVGFEIIQTRSYNVSLRVDRVGLQFDAAGVLPLSLHHSSVNGPLQTINLNYSEANTFQWFDLAWDMPHISDTLDSGGAYYITYKQSEAPGQAIKKQRRWGDGSCSGCGSPAEVATWKIYSKYLEFHPFNLPEVAGNDLWDVSDNRYEYDNNHGLNFEISLYCDFTRFFVQQRREFKSVLSKRVAMDLLREIAYNPNARINQIESSVTREQILYEIDGDTRGRKTGIAAKYERAMKAISLDVEGLDRVCMPCKRRGVVYRSM